MGRGKTTAAINYMEEHKADKRFLYVTPFLKEVERICDACDFDQPDSDNTTKLSELKTLMRCGKNAAATHSLFYLLDSEALDIVREKHYSIIIDESISPIGREHISASDTKILLDSLIEVRDDDTVRWIEESYDGKFNGYKAIAESGSLLKLDGALVSIMRPELLSAFDEVIMLTYLFNGQYQKAYLDFFGFKYSVCGVKYDDGKIVFSDEPDCPPPIDLSGLITLIDDDDKINAVGNKKYSLSINWFSKKGSESNEIKQLRNNLNTFLRRRCEVADAYALWTCPKEYLGKVCGENGRHSSGFLQMSARATNEYKDRTAVAYLVNRFADPTIVKFFSTRNAFIDEDMFALGEMLQFIWRSAIRDNQPISLYIPSKRMRSLFKDWLESVSKGGEAA